MIVADAVARLKITLDDVEPMQHLAMRWRRKGRSVKPTRGWSDKE